MILGGKMVMLSVGWPTPDHVKFPIDMVMPEAAAFQPQTLVHTPLQQTKNADVENGKAMLDKTAMGGVRRPRTREVTSRYKSPTTSISPAPALNRRFPTPNGDRAATVPDLPSPKRAQSAERRRPSPTRTGEVKVSNGSSDSAVVPKRSTVRTELLWPSTRSLSSSMQAEPHSLPPNGLGKIHTDAKGKGNNYAADQTLRPSANVVQRSMDHRKPTPERKGTPLRCHNIDQVENARPQENVHKSDLQRWPASTNAKSSGAAMSRSVDLSSDRDRPLSRAASLLILGKPTYGSSRVPRPGSSSRILSQSINEGPAPSINLQKARSDSRGRRRDSPVKLVKCSSQDSPPSVSSQQNHSSANHVLHQAGQALHQAVEPACPENAVPTDNASDTDSVSSGGTTTTSSSRGTPVSSTGTRTGRGTTVPARFWQDAANRSRRLSENSKLRASMPESDFSATSMGRSNIRHKTTISSENVTGLIPVMIGGAPPSPWSIVPNRSVSAFLPPQQPLSPIKTSPYRNIPSPARSRGTPPPLPSQSHRSSSAAVMLNFGADTRKGKKGLSQIEESHLHRILQNRLLQWRFVNARADAAMNAQAFSAENSLYNVCSRIFDMRTSVTLKRIRLQQARQAHKLQSLLSAQAPKLEEWSSLQNEHMSALTGAVQALEAAVLQVPVTGGVKADTVAVKKAIGSAFDVMNSVENSVNFILPKAEKTNSLVSELAHVVAQERVLMEECADLLALTSALEVEERSMRTHLLQLGYERARVLGHLIDSTTAPDSVLVGSPS